MIFLYFNSSRQQFLHKLSNLEWIFLLSNMAGNMPGNRKTPLIVLIPADRPESILVNSPHKPPKWKSTWQHLPLLMDFKIDHCRVF